MPPCLAKSAVLPAPHPGAAAAGPKRIARRNATPYRLRGPFRGTDSLQHRFWVPPQPIQASLVRKFCDISVTEFTFLLHGTQAEDDGQVDRP
ncbi:MAG: hypothetical protein BroJett030_28950 [Alphaproteobacteria bacterium]|nr:MAG: hypothetical protein BroJett030_28950 [Alphaproteobacteria bacterium]